MQVKKIKSFYFFLGYLLELYIDRNLASFLKFWCSYGYGKSQNVDMNLAR
jgi:hypothetical protein